MATCKPDKNLRYYYQMKTKQGVAWQSRFGQLQ
jgi:hypothetical protein